jgi:hypothetical protein
MERKTKRILVDLGGIFFGVLVEYVSGGLTRGCGDV